MWRCKKCGCTHFNLFFLGKVEAEFDSVEVVENFNFDDVIDFIESID